ncbi:hypothetical protein [Arcticibacter sp. MXS-1]|uniref:hypothetical protein n=1 Tax=Arcticibacter sp. MXS-1 TaxID=3341726 RepID=UPI0035A96402
MDQFNEKRTEADRTSPPDKRSTMSPGKKKYLITIGVALILLISLWIWKSVEISGIRNASEKEKQNLKEQATSEIAEVHKQHLLLLAKPFVWAVRTELMQGNRNQVNLYLNDMVKEKNFQQIAIADNKGKIIASTNKKDEGQPFSSIASAGSLNNNDTNIETQSDSTLVMTSPVMGFNSRLGTLLIRYTIPQTRFE